MYILGVVNKILFPRGVSNNSLHTSIIKVIIIHGKISSDLTLNRSVIVNTNG